MPVDPTSRYHWTEQEMFCENCKENQILWLVDHHKETVICLGPILNRELMEMITGLLNEAYDDGCAHGAGR